MKVILLWLYLFTFIGTLTATPQLSLDDYLEKLDELESSDLTTEKKYLSLVNEGIKIYPDNVSLYMKKANYLATKEKYKESIITYKIALEKPFNDNTTIYYYLSYLYGYVGDYKNALEYNKKIEGTYLFDETLAYLLLWNYYKNFLLEEAISKGEKFLMIYPDSASIHSVIALLYMDLYRYDESLYYFSKAIDLSLAQGRPDLASSNYYNEYLLEMQFLNYEKAESNLMNAIALNANSDNYLIMGIFQMEKLNYTNALDSFKTSQNMELDDSLRGIGSRSPNPHMEQIKLEILFNKFDSALKLLKEVENFKNVRWMTQYSTYPDLHKGNIYALYSDYYESKIDFLKAKVFSSHWQYLKNYLNVCYLSFYSWYYKSKHRPYAIKSAKIYANAKNPISSFNQYINASDDYNHAKNYFIKKSADYEIPHVPKSSYHYQAMIGKIKKDKVKLKDSLSRVDSIYEKKMKVGILAYLIELSKKDERIYWQTELYNVHPPSSYIYKLPLSLYIDDRRLKNTFKLSKLVKILKRAFVIMDKQSYRLNIVINDHSVDYTLFYDKNLMKNSSLALNQKIKTIDILTAIEAMIYEL